MIVDSTLVVVILIAAGVSALSPITLGILVLLISAVLGKGHRTRRMFWLGIAFILVLLTVSLLWGVLALYAWHLLPPVASQYLAISVGLFVVGAGLTEIKQFFWYGQGLRLALGKRSTAYVKGLTKGRFTLAQTVQLGIWTSAVAVPSTCAAYLAVLALLRNSVSYTSLSLVGLYNLVFVLPLVVIVGLTANGTRLSVIQRWKEEGKGTMRLGIGMLLIALGWIIILSANGVINLE